MLYPVEGASVTGVLHLPAGNGKTFSHSTVLEQDSCPCTFKMQSVTEFDAEPHPLDGVFTSNFMNPHCFGKGFRTDDPPSASHDEYLRSDVDAVQNVKVTSGKSEKPHFVKIQCASRHEASHLANIRVQEVSQTTSALKFLECDESLDLKSYDTLETFAPDDELEVDSDELQADQLCPIGERVATAGWYACEGEAIVLVHDDGCCSFFDVANMEEKAVYQCPKGYPVISWNDCWLVRAAGPAGRANKYIVSATSGSVLDAGFCSWDFHNRKGAAHHSEDHFTWLDLNMSAQSSPIERSSGTKTDVSFSSDNIP